jgi:transposase
MRGRISDAPQLFAMFHVEDRIRPDHPLRRIKECADEILRGMSRTFTAMYSEIGRPSVPPEQLLKSQLLIALYSVRSDRLFCDRLDTDLLFRWFLDLDLDAPSIDHSTFSRNRERLLRHEVAHKFFEKVVEFARGKRLLSHEHFTVDGTLIEALASMKSFRPKDEERNPKDPDDQDPGAAQEILRERNPSVDFHGEKRSNATHRSTTDPEARLYKKSRGAASRLGYIGNAVMENRHGLCVGYRLDQANGRSERIGAMRLVKKLIRQGFAPKTLGADKAYHTKAFVAFCRENQLKPHLSLHSGRQTPGLDARTTRHESYRISQRKRKLIEQKFGWGKQIGGMRKSRFLGRKKTEAHRLLAMAAYNLIRISRLLEPTPA